MIRLWSRVIAAALIVSAWLFAGYPPLFSGKQSYCPLVFSPKGNVLAVGKSVIDGLASKAVSPIRFLDANSGKDVGEPLNTALPKPVGAIQAVDRDVREIHELRYSPDEKFLALLQDPYGYGHMNRWDLIVFEKSKAEPLLVVPVSYSQWARIPTTINFFSSDSQLLIWTECDDKKSSVHVWDLAQQKERFTLADVAHPVMSPNGEVIATLPNWRNRQGNAAPYSLQLWDARTGQLSREIQLHGTWWAWTPGISFSPDGRFLATNSLRGDGTPTVVEVFDFATGNCVFSQQAFSPALLGDGQTLAIVRGQNIELWDTKTWTLRTKVAFNLGKHWDNGADIPPSPQVLRPTSFMVVTEYYPTISGLAFSRVFKPLRLNFFGDNRFTVVDGTSGSKQPIAMHDSLLLNKQVSSPDGRKVAFGTMDGNLSVWQIPPRRSLVPLMLAAITTAVVLTGAEFLIRRGPTSAMSHLPSTEKAR